MVMVLYEPYHNAHNNEYYMLTCTASTPYNNQQAATNTSRAGDRTPLTKYT